MKPMLAVDAGDLDALDYPMLASAKIDGIRVLITKDGPLTRSLKPVPNEYISKCLEALPVGLDGEVVALDEDGNPDFRLTTSAVRRASGHPAFMFYVFDDFTAPGGYTERLASAYRKVQESQMPHAEFLPPYQVDDPAEVLEYYQGLIDDGYEGVILRAPDGAYKHGRSTLKEQGMLKVKPWADAEAVIVDMVERMHNANEAKTNALGRTERSSHKENKIPRGDMGTLVVKSDLFSETFELGTGFTDADRTEFWQNRDKYVGTTVVFKYALAGGYDLPRHPVYKGIRIPEDMS